MRKDFFLTYDAAARVLGKLRRRKGLSQDALAARTGIGGRTISSFETGRRVETMKLRHIVQLCDELGVTPEQFFREIGVTEGTTSREDLR